MPPSAHTTGRVGRAHESPGDAHADERAAVVQRDLARHFEHAFAHGCAVRGRRQRRAADRIDGSLFVGAHRMLQLIGTSQ